MIVSIRRGPGADLASITFVAVDGRALHATVYGLGPDETVRNREELIRWLTATGIALTDAEGRSL